MDSKRIVFIGATGHIGSFLVPRLVRAGHDVVTISRGSRSAYVDAPEWQHVEQVTADREQEDRDGTFGNRVVALRPDVVIDLVCFTVESAAALVAALRGTDVHLVTTSLHPGHISGPGWAPIGPVGNLDPTVWRTLSAGEPLPVPGLGAESMHHVHADDVAQAFELAVEHRDAAAGQDFTVVAPTALTVRGYAALAASWFGREARLDSVSWDRFRQAVPAEHAEASWEHLSRSHVFSIDKARRLLGYAPRYTAEETVLDAVRWLVDNDEVAVAGPLVV